MILAGLLSDEKYMSIALDLAREARKIDEVPVGAIVVTSEGEIVASKMNRREADHSPIAHAELLALDEASKRLGRWRLTGCTLFVTLEPCVMCAGALVLARVDRVVYGARDPKAGAVESIYRVLADPRLNHQPTVVAGVLEAECSTLLSDFFREKRKKPIQA